MPQGWGGYQQWAPDSVWEAGARVDTKLSLMRGREEGGLQESESATDGAVGALGGWVVGRGSKEGATGPACRPRARNFD